MPQQHYDVQVGDTIYTVEAADDASALTLARQEASRSPSMAETIGRHVNVPFLGSETAASFVRGKVREGYNADNPSGALLRALVPRPLARLGYDSLASLTTPASVATLGLAKFGLPSVVAKLRPPVTETPTPLPAGYVGSYRNLFKESLPPPFRRFPPPRPSSPEIEALPSPSTFRPSPTPTATIPGETLPPIPSSNQILHNVRREVGSEEAGRLAGLSRTQVKAATPEMEPGILPRKAERSYVAHPEYGEGVQPPEGPIRKPFREDQRGFTIPPAAVPLATGAAGALYGGATGKNPDDRLGRALLFGAGGAALGGAALGGGTKNVGQLASTIRRESMLSGRAIPLNIATDFIGAPIRATLENTGSTPLAPLQEIGRLPTNMRTFAQTWQQPTRRGLAAADRPSMMGPVGRTINALDETAWQAMKRAGLSDEEIDRLLHTQDRPPLFTGRAQPVMKEVVPFQKVPLNMLNSGGAEMADLGRSNVPLMRKAITIGSLPYGAAVGAEAKKQFPRHPFLTAMLAPAALAALGPTTIPATIAAIAAAGPRAGLGTVSPLPEFGFDPRMVQKNKGGFVPSFYRLLHPTQP